MTDPTERLVEMAFADVGEVEAWLRRFPYLTVTREQSALIVRHANGFTTGFGNLSPLDAGIALAFAVIGPLWMYAAPDLLARIDRELKRRKTHDR